MEDSSSDPKISNKIDEILKSSNNIFLSCDDQGSCRSSFLEVCTKSETKKEVEYLGFWVISGGADPGKERPISIKNLTIKELIEQSEKGLVHLLETFLDSSQPYISLPRIDKAPPKEWRDYDHLARVSEWADIEEEGIEAA